MKTVTVSLEDLEAIVFATGVIKTIEGALASRKDDPFVKPYLDYTEAHNRLATAMRDARRADADTLVKYDAPLDDDEKQALTLLAKREDLTELGKAEAFSISTAQKAPGPGESMSVYDKLAAKGCVVMGNFVRGVLWAGASAAELAPYTDAGFAIKTTVRGRAKLGGP
ncbi:MAG TPA: hypothetical protein VHC20_08260 [Candidatus Paceibacterota bacterium]|nr:hypothetical protein [Candidatus Paceibacterota bacterium]